MVFNILKRILHNIAYTYILLDYFFFLRGLLLLLLILYLFIMPSAGCSSGAVAESVRALNWQPGGPGFESRCGNFASELWQCLSEETPPAPSIW